MKTKEEIIAILESEFGYVYCHNCAYNMNNKACEDCHRKYMNWEISPIVSEKIANEILN